MIRFCGKSYHLYSPGGLTCFFRWARVPWRGATSCQSASKADIPRDGCARAGFPDARPVRGDLPEEAHPGQDAHPQLLPRQHLHIPQAGRGRRLRQDLLDHQDYSNWRDIIICWSIICVMCNCNNRSLSLISLCIRKTTVSVFNQMKYHCDTRVKYMFLVLNLLLWLFI